MVTRLYRHVLGLDWVCLICALIHISEEVHIQSVSDSVRANDADDFVILPCDFKTATYETPQITWYKEGEERRRVMRFDIRNRLTSYGEFLNRVSRGDRGALVLLRPTTQDSGNYSCEIEVDKEIPAWVKRTVLLDVVATHSLVTAFAQLGMCLIIVGIICMELSLSSTSSTETTLYRYIGLSTGITGVVIVIVTTVTWLRLPLKGHVKNKPTKKTDEEVGGELDELSTPLKEEEGDKPIRLSLKGGERAGVKLVQYRNFTKCTGMVSTSNKDIYVTTPSSIYHMEPTDNVNELKLSKFCERKEELLTITRYKQELLICGKDLTEKYFFSDKNKHYMLHVRVADRRLKANDIGHCVSWAQEGRNDDYLYLCDPDRGYVCKTTLSGKQLSRFGDSVLRKPACIVQNSSYFFIVADSVKHDMFVFDANGGFVTTMKISVPKEYEHELNGCNRLAVGPDDKIYATGTNSKHVVVFSADFRFERRLPTGADASGGISSLMVHNNCLYVAHEDCVRIHSLSSVQGNV